MKLQLLSPKAIKSTLKTERFTELKRDSLEQVRGGTGNYLLGNYLS
jgi:hypothetical protein